MAVARGAVQLREAGTDGAQTLRSDFKIRGYLCRPLRAIHTLMVGPGGRGGDSGRNGCAGGDWSGRPIQKRHQGGQGWVGFVVFLRRRRRCIFFFCKRLGGRTGFAAQPGNQFGGEA